LAIAAGLIQKGKKVLSIDLDSQCNLTMCSEAQPDFATKFKIRHLKK